MKSLDECNAYEFTRADEAAESRAASAIEAWISGQLLRPMETFHFRATAEEMVRLESALSDLLTCHELRADPGMMRIKVNDVRAALRAPLVRFVSDPGMRSFIVRAWEEK